MGLTPILRWEKALGQVEASKGELLGGLEVSVDVGELIQRGSL